LAELPPVGDAGAVDVTSVAPIDASLDAPTSDVFEEPPATTCATGQTMCAGMCVDIGSDSANCGGCGVACGGTCTAGRCLEQLAATGGQALTVDADGVYWWDYSQASSTPAPLLRVSLDGGAVTTLAMGDNAATLWDLEVQQHRLYWPSTGTGGGGVITVPTSGGAATMLVASEAGNGTGAAIHGDNVYWTCSQSPGGTLLVAPLSGGAATTLTTGRGSYIDVVSAPDRVCWVDGDLVEPLCIPLDGGAVTTLATSAGGWPAIATDSTDVYWAAGAWSFGGTTDFVAIPFDGGATATIAALPGNVMSITTDDANVYWTYGGTLSSGSDAAVLRAPRGGGPVVTLATGQGGVFGVAVDATSVYWTTATAIMKLTPK
jgi:hypothetical protein